MAKIALIGLYDTWTLGLRTMANALLSRGHETSIIHFKMPAMFNQPFFLKHTQQYQTLNTAHARDQVVVNWYNTDAVMWTYNEVRLLGDLLEEISPDIIGLSARCVYEKSLFDLLGQMRRVKNAVTIAGGHDASFRPELYLDHLDFVCVGEGEEAMLKLAATVDGPGEPREINNLVYREKGRTTANPLLSPSDEEDFFFRPDMNRVSHYLIDNNRITEVDFLFRDMTFPANFKEYYTMMGRGCTGTCTFCSAGQFRRLYTRQNLPVKARRQRPIGNIVEESLFAKENGFNKIYFLDSFLLAGQTYLLEFFRAYHQAEGPPFFAQLQPEQMLAHPELFEAALKAGLDETVIGIQSGSERVNRDIFKRKTSHDKILNFAEMITGRENLKVDYHLITHNPFETEADFQETLAMIERLPKRNTRLVLRPLKAFAGSEIHRMIEDLKPGPLDMEAHYKLLLLYLIRYSVPDHEFSKIQDGFPDMSLDDLSRAYAELKKIYRSEGDWTHYGHQLLNRGDPDGALAAFSAALERNPDCYEAFCGQGWAYLKKGDIAQAAAAFQKALKQYPRGAYNLWVGLIEVFEQSGRFQELIECAGRVRSILTPYYAQEYGSLILKSAWAYFQLRQMEKAQVLYREALDYVDGKTRRQLLELLDRMKSAAPDRRKTQPAAEQQL